MATVWGLRGSVDGVDCIGESGVENEFLNMGGALMRRAVERGSELYVVEVSKINDNKDVLLLLWKYLHSRKHS